LIKERAFNKKVEFDAGQQPGFDKFVEPVDLPPRLGYLPNSIVTRAEVSKFNHYTFTYTDEEKGTFRQNLMGPYWDLKLEVLDANGEVDKRVSYVEILESYYRAVLKSKGTIIKNRAREIVFSLPLEENTLWVRLMVTMDGIYFLKMIEQSPQDYTEPELVYPKAERDSTQTGDK
jgi:hypothetical protein